MRRGGIPGSSELMKSGVRWVLTSEDRSRPTQGINSYGMRVKIAKTRVDVEALVGRRTWELKGKEVQSLLVIWLLIRMRREVQSGAWFTSLSLSLSCRRHPKSWEATRVPPGKKLGNAMIAFSGAHSQPKPLVSLNFTYDKK
jgi:hypothetical protein